MKHFLLVAFSLFSLTAFAQVNEKVNIKDIDQDGVLDTLITWYEGGSGFGGDFAKVVNGKTGEIFEMNDFASFAEIKKVVTLPPDFETEKKSPYYNALIDALFPSIITTPDITLDWIIRANHLAIIPENPGNLDLVLPISHVWSKNPILKPNNYQIKLSNLEVQILYHESMESPGYSQEVKTGYLSYLAHNHEFNLKKVQIEDSDFSIIKGKHSLILEKGENQSVLFITDYPLTSGPDKLRWESIGHIWGKGDYAFFSHSQASTPSFKLFIAHLPSGAVGRLKPELSGSDEYFVIEENNLYNNKGEVVLENVSQIIMQFNLLNPNFQ